ncbi:NAD(P)H-hydrate dehydratase [Antarcticibacterium sp. 1MA-6-2]|uniref:NAD(P)H-hydrate dehydratase n=1 Tax=Antarcticibacterium sp. 1MA-6-2 TaxID=2908210 RepID=UPI0028831D68|nr:NAD(P)H-hydrate dehydratase [Antarcticibacterium sp. 1MA-6-2]
MVTIYAPSCGYEILQTVLPEAMVITDTGERELENIQVEMQPSVICFGMGAGTSEKTLETYAKFLQKLKEPLVIDADGLNMLSKNKKLIDYVPKGSVLTPHPKELERLIGEWKDDFHKIKKAKEFSRKHELILVLKDAHTIIVSGDDLYVNNTGNPGMATAGAGDVLAGIITGLISQKYEPLIAAVFGTYLHGRAGDLAAASMGFESMVAGDLTRFLGEAYKDLFKNGN